MFATTNTVGLGDTTGLYHGTQQINQGQMDRWNIVSTLNYLSSEKELEIILAKNKKYNNKEGKEVLSNMIKVADLTRKGFMLRRYLYCNESKNCIALGRKYKYF